MTDMVVYPDRQAWLTGRNGTIGGSDAAAVLGLNPYKSNTQLWEELSGKSSSPEFDNEAMAYGRAAEPHIRGLFDADYSELEVEYRENNLWLNDDFPYAHASLDGWLTDGDRRMGILEIKTATLKSQTALEKWKGRVPDNYYVQVLFYMMVCEAEFAYLRAQLKFCWERETEIRTYRFDRSEVEADIQMIRSECEKFWGYVRNGIRPPAILPRI